MNLRQSKACCRLSIHRKNKCAYIGIYSWEIKQYNVKPRFIKTCEHRNSMITWHILYGIKV